MTETPERDGAIRDGEAGAPVDRIEGGTLASTGRDFQGIAPATVLIGAIVVVLIGLFLGWYLFHARGSAGKAAPAVTAGTAAPVPQRDAITAAQAREALTGTPADAGVVPGAGPGGTTAGAAGQQLPVGMTGGTAGAASGTATPANPAGQKVDPAVALALASRRSPIMGFSGGSMASQAARAPDDQPPQPGGEGTPAMSFAQSGGGGGERAQPVAATGPSAATAQDGLSSQLGHHVIETARATVVPDRAFLLSAGTLVPCTLQTAINSTQAGYVSCVIGHDVYSEDGRVVLLDKGTKVLGQYSGGIAQGQARLFVLWTRALTPRGVAIDLGSPASDDLGRAGMAGGVDTMFWQRFGGALMLSVLEDLGNIASSHFAGAGTQTTQVPADTAGVALQNTINIRPILKKNQGDQVAIFVAKDFDFSSVYNVHVRQ
ncbi:type IV secretion system protein VirB10 [Sphingomonas oryzagri]